MTEETLSSNPSPPGDLPENAEATYSAGYNGGSFAGKALEEELGSTFGELPLFPAEFEEPTDGPGAESSGARTRKEILKELAQQSAQAVMASPAAGYRLLRKFAMGGCGEIWEAEQKSLRRVVAVKRIRLDRIEQKYKSAHTVEEKARIFAQYMFQFRYEALLAGALEHPNILPVHDLAMDADARLLLAMKRVEGQPWSKVLKSDFHSLDPQEYLSKHLEIFIQASQGVAYAHSRGIVHRDIKPSQVIVGDYGEVLLMDWGLSVSVDGTELPDRWKPETQPVPPTIHMAAMPSGTPFLMAPEQTLNEPDQIGPWTDVYLLGATLYYVLTLHWPRNGDSSAEVFVKASKGIVEPIDQAESKIPIPEDLRNIIEMAMISDYQQREMTVAELIQRVTEFRRGHSQKRESERIVNDVERLLESSPATYTEMTRLLNKLENASNLWPANPAVMKLKERIFAIYTKTALKNSDLVLARLYAERVSNIPLRVDLLEQTNSAERTAIRLKKQRQTAQAGVYALLVISLLFAIVSVYQKERADRSLMEKNQALDLATANEKRALVAADKAMSEQYFAGINLVSTFLKEGHPERARDYLLTQIPASKRDFAWGLMIADVSSDDMTLVADSLDENFALFHTDVSPDGRIAAVGKSAGRLTLYDLLSGEEIASYDYPLRGIWCVDFNADGSHILLTSLEGHARIVEASSGKILKEFSVYEDNTRNYLRGGVLSPDGKLAFTTGAKQNLTIWDLETGSPMHQIPFASVTYDVAVRPDGKEAVVVPLAGDDPAVIDVVTGEIRQRLEIEGTTSALGVNYSQDGHYFVVCYENDMIGLFESDSLELVRSYEFKGSPPNDAAISPDGNYVAAVNGEGVIRVWDRDSAIPLLQLYGAKQMEKVAFHPRENWIIGTAFDTIKVWNLDRIVPRRISNHEAESLNKAPIAFTTSLPSFPGKDYGGIWSHYDRVWMANHGRTFFRNEEGLLCIDNFYNHYSPDGKWRIHHNEETRRAELYRRGQQKPVKTFPEMTVFQAAFSHDNSLAAISHGEGILTLYDTETWKPIKSSDVYNSYQGVLWSLRFTADDQRIVCGWQNGDVSLLDIGQWKVLWQVSPHPRGKPIVDLDISNDGSKILTASSNEVSQVLAMENGNVTATMEGHRLNVLAAEFSPDDQHVLTVSMDNTARLWNAADGRMVAVLYDSGENDDLMGGGFSNDGNSVYLVTRKGAVQQLPTLPWKVSDYECEHSRITMECLEQWKRANRKLAILNN